MAKITRFTQRIFGSGAGTDQIAQFGSLFAGSPTFTTTASTAQSLSNWLTGWFGAAIDSNSPAIEDMNACFFVLTTQLAYLGQAGIAEWDAETTYYNGSLANVDGEIFCSITDDNLNNNPSGDFDNWLKVGGRIMSALGDMTYGGTSGEITRLPGHTDASLAFLAQTGAGSGVSAAPEWRPVLAPTVQKFTSGSGTYTRPTPAPKYIRVRMAGGGGGGSGSGTSGATNGSVGAASTFGGILSAGGGNGGVYQSVGAAGGTPSVGGGAVDMASALGGMGMGFGFQNSVANNSVLLAGASGGETPFFGGGGKGGHANTVGIGGLVNTGGGGQGGGSGPLANCFTGTGGGSGAYVDAVISDPAATYAYAVGAGGAKGNAGGTGYDGGAGASGIIIVEEYYQ